jgi:hypothetical protein
MRATLARRRLSLTSGWLGVLFSHTIFLICLVAVVITPGFPLGASLHSSCTYYPAPCLFTHSMDPTSTHHFPCTGVCFFGLFLFFTSLYTFPFLLFCYLFLFCPLSDRLLGSLHQRTHTTTMRNAFGLKHGCLVAISNVNVGFGYYYYCCRRLLMRLWNNTPFCCPFFLLLITYLNLCTVAYFYLFRPHLTSSLSLPFELYPIPFPRCHS